MNKILTIKDLNKRFHTPEGEIEAIKNISFDVYENEIIGIVGSSGCGKSTLLNILAELEEKTEGEIIKNGHTFSYMLQSDALLPWLNVLDNACLGLEIKNIKTKENIEYVKNLLINFGLVQFLDAYPNSLSGGMKQRVG